MATVVCAIDETDGSEALDAAVEFCLEFGARLHLVGVVRESLGDSTRGSAGERVRRRRAVSAALERAAAAARSAGLLVTTSMRVGRVEKELLREAEAVDAGELFFVRTSSWIVAALTGGPRREAVHLSMGEPTVRKLAAAA